MSGGRTPWTDDRTDQLCELIANGAQIAAAARILGVSKDAATGRFHRIRESFGEQGR